MKLSTRVSDSGKVIFFHGELCEKNFQDCLSLTPTMLGRQINTCKILESADGFLVPLISCVYLHLLKERTCFLFCRLEKAASDQSAIFLSAFSRQVTIIRCNHAACSWQPSSPRAPEPTQRKILNMWLLTSWVNFFFLALNIHLSWSTLQSKM